MFVDYSYLVLIVPVLLLSLAAQARVNTVYRRFSQIGNQEGLTGAMAAQAVLEHYGIHNVRIEHIRGKLNDHYDPKTNVIRLSDGVYGGCSIAAVGIACHEAGHAAQHALGYRPIRWRNACVLPAQIGSNAAIPLAICGLIFDAPLLVNIGIALYIAVMLFELVTLPVEFNASNRAIAVIEETGLLNPQEVGGAQKVLRAAAMTYVASFAMAAMNLLRLILLAKRED